MNTGLTEREIELIVNVLRENPKLTKAVIFGSRAKGNYRANSDVDIAIFGVGDIFETQSIAEKLEDLPLPYKFDAQNYETIKNEDLRRQIDSAGVCLYERA